MIDAGSIKHKGLAELYRTGRTSKVQTALVERTKQRLDVLDAAEDIEDTASAFQSLRIHKLKGKKRGTWSMWINGPWRLTFRFKNGHVYDLDLEQYH